jgi:hypothetical protein
MFEVGKHGDAGKHAIGPIQQWFRDLTTPIFLKLFANPKASNWMYSYRVDWDAPVSIIKDVPTPPSSQKTTSSVRVR